MTQRSTIKTFVIVLTLIMIAGMAVPPVSAGNDYWTVLTSINVTSWTDMANNLTNVRDNMLPANISMAISASSTNITALQGNGTVVFNNGSVAGYNLTTTMSQIMALGSTQSMNFTTPKTGTYLIFANIRENRTLLTNIPSSTITFSMFALCDANNTNIVANSERMGTQLKQIDNITSQTDQFTWLYTNNTGTSEVGICGNTSASINGPWMVDSGAQGRSALSYVRLP